MVEGSCQVPLLSFFSCVLAPGFLLLLLASRWQARPGKNSKNVRIVWRRFDLAGLFSPEVWGCEEFSEGSKRIPGRSILRLVRGSS